MSNGTLYATDPKTGAWTQVGNPDFADTRFLFAAMGKLFTIESGGDL